MQFLYQEQPEVLGLKNEIKRLVADLKAQTDENLQERTQLQTMFEQYDQKFEGFNQLKQENDSLKAQLQQVASSVSKETVS